MKRKTLTAEIYTIWGTNTRALRLSYRGRGLLDTCKESNDKEREAQAAEYAERNGYTGIRWALVQ